MDLKDVSIIDPPGPVKIEVNYPIDREIIKDLTIKGQDPQAIIKNQLLTELVREMDKMDLIEYMIIDNPANPRVEARARIKVFSIYPKIKIMM